MITESEAKKKACCNGAARPAQNGSCIASECMGWRWAPPPAPPAAPANVDPETVRLLYAGQKIGAIKHDRNTSGRGLKESKDYVEGLAASLGLPSWSTSERSGYCGLAGAQP